MVNINSMQPSIVLVGPAYPYRGGNALFMSYLYEALASRFNVTFLNYTLLYPALLFPGTTQYDESQGMVKAVPNERVLHSVNPASWLRTARRIHALKPDLVAIDWWNPFFGLCHRAVTTMLGREYRHKMLFITENFISHEARAIDRVLTNIGLHDASCFLALSAIVERDLKQLAGERKIYRSELPVFDFYTLSTAERASKAEFGFADDAEILLFFGYVRKYKGLDVLLRALPLIRKERPKAKLLVAGEFYDEPNLYTSIIAELKLEPHVKLINRFIPNEEVRRFYDVCDVVVQPYRSATQSGILNIAYGFGTPAIVTRVGGLEECMEDGVTGCIAEPDSPESLAQAVHRFFALKSSVDFTANVRQRAAANGFGRVGDVFAQILADCART
jgi:glycosyltransferase involved in cell wall biosynthesis